MAKKQELSDNVVARNRRASHDYHFLEQFEAGLVLTGTEIKSVRAHKVSLQHSYIQPQNGELWLVNANIAEYEHGNRQNHDPVRQRKLLLHRREVNRILTQLAQKGLTCVPIRMIMRRGRAKLEFAVARGQREYDKRASLREADDRREVERALSRRWKEDFEP